MRAIVLSAAVAAICMPVWQAAAQSDNVNPDEIIRKFAAKEAEFAEARNNYTYRLSLKMEELDGQGKPTGGKWQEADDMILSPDGKRTEKAVYAPTISLQHIALRPDEVKAALRDLQPFLLTTDGIGKYDIGYRGREQLQEVDPLLGLPTGNSRSCFAFSAKPKNALEGERPFEGQVWVDDRNYQIVKTSGKGVRLVINKKDEYPLFVTDRGQIDGKYWFPMYARADETLQFSNMRQRFRMTVEYHDYRRQSGTVRHGDVMDDGGAGKKPLDPPSGKK